MANEKRFVVTCPKCGHKFNLEYWECEFDDYGIEPERTFDDKTKRYWKIPEDYFGDRVYDHGEYDHLTCKNCGYREKID